MDTIAYIVNYKGTGPSIPVEIADTPEAAQAALSFFRSLGDSNLMAEYNYDLADNVEVDQEVWDYFFPTCEHGISASLCAGPSHYPLNM